MKKIIIEGFSHPMRLYIIWILLMITFCLIGIPIFSAGHSDGEQIPLILLGYILDIGVGGLILISLLSPIIYWKWYKKYWFIPLLVPVTILVFLIYLVIDVYISNGYHFAL